MSCGRTVLRPIGGRRMTTTTALAADSSLSLRDSALSSSTSEFHIAKAVTLRSRHSICTRCHPVFVTPQRFPSSPTDAQCPRTRFRKRPRSSTPVVLCSNNQTSCTDAAMTNSAVCTTKRRFKPSTSRTKKIQPANSRTLRACSSVIGPQHPATAQSPQTRRPPATRVALLAVRQFVRVRRLRWS
jgi:hypothetical protein